MCCGFTCFHARARLERFELHRIGHCSSIWTPYDCYCGERVDRDQRGSNRKRQRSVFIRDSAAPRRCSSSPISRNTLRRSCTPTSGKKGKHQILLKMADKYIANRTTACLSLFLAYRVKPALPAEQVHQLNLQGWEQMITESSQHGETRCAICLSGSRILQKMWWAQDLQNLVVQLLYIPLVLGNTMRSRTSPQGPNCEICKRTKMTRALRRKRTSNHIRPAQKVR